MSGEQDKLFGKAFADPSEREPEGYLRGYVKIRADEIGVIITRKLYSR